MAAGSMSSNAIFPRSWGSHCGYGRPPAVGLVGGALVGFARSIDDMVIKYEALQWSLLDDGAVFDTAVRRQVVAFRRDLVALAGSR